VYGGGWGAEAILVDPCRNTTCYACTAQVMGRVGMEIGPEVETPPAYALRSPSPNQQSWAEADLCSIMPAAALAARMAVAWLAAPRSQDRCWYDLTQGEINAWRIAFRQVPAWKLDPWCLQPVPARRQPGCPLCGIDRHRDPAGSLAELLQGKPA